MGTRGWNGLDELSATEVLALYRPDAARWYTTLDPAGLVSADEDPDDVARGFAHAFDLRGETWKRAIRYALACRFDAWCASYVADEEG